LDNQQIFNALFSQRHAPEIYREPLWRIFSGVVENLEVKVEKADIRDFIINPSVIFNYIYEETGYNLQIIKNDEKISFVNNDNYVKTEIKIISDKIFFNEFIVFSSPSLVSRYSPLVTTYTFMINFILKTFSQLNKQGTQERGLLLDILQKGFVMSKTIINLLVQGSNTESFSTWRTLHEVECIAKILYENPYLTSTYIKHMDYAKYYRNEDEDPTVAEKVIGEVREKMKPYNLKSKDTKKYIEYGWLYSYKNVLEKFPEFRPNFRKGIELIAGLTSYSKLYEMSSELAHSSPILIYSNQDYFKSLTLLCLYDTFFRLEAIFSSVLMKEEKGNFKTYFNLRKNFLKEMRKNIQIELFNFNKKYKRKYPKSNDKNLEEEKDSD
jgi:hypothetical protein